MNSKTSNKFYNQSENLFSNQNTNENPYLEVDSSYPFKIENQNNKTFQYFPIVTKHSCNGNHTIYLAAEDNGNINNYIINNQNYVYRPNESQKKVKKKNKNKILVPQKSIELQIKNSKFEYLLNNPKNKESSYINADNIKSNTNKELTSINKEKKENSKNNYKNIKNDFISTTQNLFDKSKEKENKELIHSYSVENYGDVLNKSLSNFTENLDKIENSKIMNQNFINNIRNPKRKNNLMKMLEKYKILNKININDSLNNSFTLGVNQDKYRQKSAGRLYKLRNSDNIIEEDENENSENDTIKEKPNSKNKDNIKRDKDIKKTDANNNTSECETEKRMIEKCKKELGNIDRIKKVKKGDIMKKLKLKNISKNEKDFSNDDIKIVKDNKKLNEKDTKINLIDFTKNKTNLKYNIINSDRGNKISNEFFAKKIGQNNNMVNIFKEFYKKNHGKKNINKTKDESSNLNETNDNDIINSINKINKSMLNNNKNIPCNIYKNIYKNKNGHKPQEVLVRKILREERYIIDENGKEKVLAINQSLLNENDNKNNLIKEPENDDKNLNKKNIVDNNYDSIEEKIIKKERYHRNINKVPEKKVIDLYEIQKKNNSFNISKIIPNNKVKRIHTTLSPSYLISQSKTTQNSQKKERFHNINFQKINNPVVIKQMDKILQRNSPNNNMYRRQYQNININNNLNHVIYIQNQTSPNKSTKNDTPKIKPEIHQRNKFGNYINKNHSYHEINSISDRKANTISKTIYHDYSNLDKIMFINKSTTNISNRENNSKENKGVLSRNFSLNNFQRPIAKTSKDIIIENIYVNSDKSYKYEKNISNDKMMEKNYKVFDRMNSDFNNKYNRNVIKIENKNKYYKRKKPPNLIKKNNNTIFNGVPFGDNDYFMNENYIYEQSNRVYPNSNSNNKYYRNKPVKSCYIKEINTFEEREYNL